MIEKLYLLFEIIAVMIFLWALHGSKKRPGISVFVYICVELLLIMLVDAGTVSAEYLSVAYLGIALVDILEFGDHIKIAVMYTLADCLLMIGGQFLFGLLYTIVFRINVISNPAIMGINIAIILCGLLLHKIGLNKYMQFILKSGSLVNVIFVCAGVLLVIAFLKKAATFQFEGDLAVYVLLFFATTILIIIKLERERNQNLQYYEQLRQYEKYNLVYEELISEIRHRQHDFDNHIQAIYGTIMTYDDVEVIREEYSSYYQRLQDQQHMHHLLKQENSSVMTAFLYLKFKVLEEQGILVHYHVDAKNAERHILFPDLVELLGNLIDNAAEAVACASLKFVDITLCENDAGLLCKVVNPYDWNDKAEVKKFMKDTYSSKKNGHGFGLTNINRVVEKYHGSMQIKLGVEHEIKNIAFDILLPYRKGESE